MFRTLWNTSSNLIINTNQKLKDYSPATLIVATVATGLLLQKAYQTYGEPILEALHESKPKQYNKKQLNKSFAQLFKDAPVLGPIIRAETVGEIRKFSTEIQNDVDKMRKNLGPAILKMPEKGIPKEEILNLMSKANMHYEKGRSSGTWYARPDKDYEAFLDKVYSLTKFTNPMHDDEFPLINRMSSEVISMCQYLFNGDPSKFNKDTVKKLPGLLTDGGTASNFEACSAYVKHARKILKIKSPEIIVPNTVHVSIDNAAERLGIKLIKVNVDPKTGAADVCAMEKAITKNTCLIVGSAPSFPCGIMDPIKELGELGLKYHIPLHVDACLGGFLTAFAKKAGFDLPASDFSVPGVMSISADPHKYGQTPKGSSVLLFHPDCNASSSAVFTNLKWAGGMYVAQGMKGSRQGHVAASTFAALVYRGEKWFVEETKKILLFTKKLTTEIAKIDGVRLAYLPQLSVIAIDTVKGINSHLVASRLKKLHHWSLNLLQTPDQEPAGFHFCVTAMHESVQEEILGKFIRSLTESVNYAKAHPNEKPAGLAGVYGVLPEVPDFLQDTIGNIYAATYGSVVSEAKPAELKGPR